MTRGQLSRDAIVDAAMELVDAGGLEALSMRAIGSRLGVQAMSLYNHVENKAALIDALHERLILSINFSVDKLAWVEALRVCSRAYRQVALAHPQAFVLLATRPLTTPAEVRHVSPVLTLLEQAGFGIRQRLLLMNVFFTALNGILLAEVAPVPGHSDVPEPDAVSVFREASAGDPSAYATAGGFADLVESSADVNIEAWFDEGVGLVLRGMATLVPDAED